jgi:type VII secretion-associated protein (TIGR03931 family)
VRAHILEVGPTAIRRLCCGGATVADSEAERVAFEHIDDPVTLIDLRPVTVESLWRSVLAAADCGTAEGVIVVHPSWWAPERVDVVGAAAHVLVGPAVLRSRSWLLTHASQAKAEHATLVVEIADDLVAVTGAAMVAQTRHRDQQAVAEAVVHSILTMVPETLHAVVIDAPRTVSGARSLSALIARELQNSGGTVAVLEIDDIGLRKLAGAIVPLESRDRAATPKAVSAGLRRNLWRLALALAVISVVVGVGTLTRHSPPRGRDDSIPTTYVVEGHVAVKVPAQWPLRRIVTGPGSARVQITSPSDPEVALHVTQSLVALPSLDATAEFLKTAIDAEPAGVFVDFNPAGHSAGRPAVTYREIRSGHDIRWTVWVDKTVRISIGCQSRQGHDEAVDQECEVAVRSARALE